MAIDGYYIKVDFKEFFEVIRLLRIDSNNINQIASMFENFVDEELNAIKEDIGSWW